MSNKKSPESLDSKEKQTMLENIRAREIVQTIMDYGVTQNQIKKILEFLAMELEDRKIMLEVCEILSEDSEMNSVKTDIEI